MATTESAEAHPAVKDRQYITLVSGDNSTTIATNIYNTRARNAALILGLIRYT